MTLSRQMVQVVRRKIAGEAMTFAESGLSVREWDELMEVLSG